MFKNRKVSAILAAPYTTWAAIFIVVPLLMIFYYGLTDETGAFTFENVAAIAQPVHLKSLGLALLLALVATVVCFLLAYPLAMILAQHGSSQGIITTLFILPMWMNFLLRTLAWMTLLENNGIINTFLKAIGAPAWNVINTPTAIVIGMVYNFLPFMILPIFNAISRIDKSVIEAAADLGANGVQTFFKVIFPLSVPGVISGITMVFIPALTTFAISTLLGGSKILLIGNVIEQEFTLSYNWNLGAGLSIVLMIFIIINMIIESLAERREEEAR